MTPTLGWLMTGVAFVAMTGLLLAKRRQTAGPGYDPTPIEKVTVTLTCQENLFTFKVEPWWAPVARGKPLEWVLHGPPDAEMTIVAKDSKTWPFPHLPPGNPHKPNHPVQAGKVKPNVKVGNTRHYSIKLECDGTTFDIDPDIFICQ